MGASRGTHGEILHRAMAIFPIALAACAAGDARPSWTGTADTLANGRIVVTSPATGVWDADSTARWQLVEELRIGTVEGTGPDLFTSISGLEVDPMGRMWILDRLSKQLRVFGPDGAHVRTIGRAGSGPGEFRDPIGLAINDAGEVWVVDPRNGRYAVFDSAGTFLTSHVRMVSGYSVPWVGGFDREGRLFEASIGELIRHDASMQPADTFAIPQHDTEVWELTVDGGQMTVDIPFSPTMVWTSDLNTGFWSGVNGEYLLHHHTFDGDTLRTFGRAYQHEPVTDEDRNEQFEQLEWFRRQGGRVDLSSLPGRKPAFTQIDVAPDGHVWVQVTAPRGVSATLFDVFDPDGRYLGQLRAPADIYPGPVFHGDRMIGAVPDTLGVSYVVSWRIAR